MRRVRVAKAGTCKTEPLKLEKFMAKEQGCQSADTITKKEIKAIAQRLKLPFDEANVRFAKAVINAYLTKQ